MKIQYMSILVLGFFYQILSGQTFEYAGQMGGNSVDYPESTVIDAMSNIYTIGHFEGTADFNPGEGVFHLTSFGSSDIFVSKIDALGNFVWAKQMGGYLHDEGISICVDAFGSIYTTGYFQGTSDFDPGVGVYNLTPTGGNDIFISKLDTDGNFEWALQIGDAGASMNSIDIGSSIAVDALGNVITTGVFEGTADFDPGNGTYLLYSQGYYNIYVLKLTTDGNFVWAKQFTGSDFDNNVSIESDDDGNILTAGAFVGTADFDPGSGTYELSSELFSFDVFITKLDASGNFVWAKQLGGSSTDMGYSINVDGNGFVYTTGVFYETADFDPGIGVYELTSLGSMDIFISKLDASGNFIWAKQFGGVSTEFLYSISLDIRGNVYTTGGFKEVVDFDPGPDSFNLTSAGSHDIFISKLDTAGNFVFVKQMGGISNDFGETICVDAFGNIFVAGGFTGIVDFDPDIETYNLTSAGEHDIFIVKLKQSSLGTFPNKEKQSGIVVYPNPGEGQYTVDAEPNTTFEIINLSGETLLSGNLTSKTSSLDISQFEKGVYILCVGNQHVKLIKQ